ncbi:hypothetical protein [Alcaligenes sp. Marseille-Q7550]
MITPTLNPTVQIANHQEVALERKDLAPCPLGIVGNLRYTAQEGGVYSLKEAKYCLDTYLDELREADLVALSQGVLSKEAACNHVLDEISIRSDDKLRMQLSGLLGDVAKAVNQFTA